MLFPEAEVTRSLSNLYKQRFVQTGEQTARVINSNQMVAEKIEELAKKMRRQADGEDRKSVV